MTTPIPRPSPLRAGCAAAALLLGGPAAAEITAGEVRDAFVEQYEAMGLAVEIGSEEASGGAITLSDVAMAFEFTEEGEDLDGPGPDPARPDRRVRVEAAFPEIAFAETPEGAVRATVPEPGEMTVTSREVGAEDGAADTARLALIPEGFALTVSEAAVPGSDGIDGSGADGGDGGAEGRRYALEADRLSVELLEATRGGEPIEGEAVLALEDVEGTTVMPTYEGSGERLLDYAQEASVGALSVRLDLPAGDASAEGGTPAGRLFLNGVTRDIAIEGEGAIPGQAFMERHADAPDPGPFLEAGMQVELALSSGSSTSELRATDPDDAAGEIVVVSEGEGGAVDLSFGPEGVGLSARNGALSYVVEGGGLPVPRVEAAIEGADATLRFPLLAGEGAEPFALGYRIEGLTINDEVWALLDPEGRLARDPVTLALSLVGRVRLLADLLDEEAQDELAAAGEMPAELEALALEARIEALGASVVADGDFTLDDEDLETFGGVPAPDGTLTVVATGIDGLLDTLSGMGLVPSDQLTPARMMLGLFARPDGSGGYTSEIVVDGEAGTVTANGQRIR